MRILFESNRTRRSFLFVCMVVTCGLVVTFAVRYHKVNAAQDNRIIDRYAQYGTEYIFEDIVYVINIPSLKKVFDEDYKEEVYRYTIPVKVINQSQKEVCIFDIVSNICILSAGKPWYGNIEKIDKEIIKYGQEAEFMINITVLKNNELDEAVYKKYSLYNIVNRPDAIIKIKYH